MTKDQFVRERRSAWRRLEEILRKMERIRGRGLDGEEVSELSRLFRGTCHDLATVRSRDWGRELEDELNSLVLRGHNHFYRAPPGRAREVLRFFTRGFPRLLRQNRAYFWVALALFLGPGLIAGVVVAVNPDLAGRMLPEKMLQQMEMMYSESREGSGGTGAESAMAGFYVYNNVGIAFQCFASGIFFGVGSVFFLIYNSIVLGVVTSVISGAGYGETFFSFVISHGSFELTAIVIAGTGGLVLGHALIHPGPHTRLDALRARGLDAVRLAGGAGAMLGVAALIEAFWSPSGVPNAAKFTVGSFLWLLVFFYLVFAGREARPE